MVFQETDWTDVVQALRPALRLLESYAAGADQSLARRRIGLKKLSFSTAPTQSVHRTSTASCRTRRRSSAAMLFWSAASYGRRDTAGTKNRHRLCTNSK